MGWHEPETQEEYIRRFHLASEVVGTGLETTQILPCAFCAARDFARIRIPQADQDLQQEATCKRCGRSGKTIITEENGAKTAEFVQTGGDDPPAWMEKPPRRV